MQKGVSIFEKKIEHNPPENYLRINIRFQEVTNEKDFRIRFDFRYSS